MDRNSEPDCRTLNSLPVATREGGVDRNANCSGNTAGCFLSPPARVAWIETSSLAAAARQWVVSPPARVAWIETRRAEEASPLRRVATREGGVDRNEITDSDLVFLDVATREGGVDRNLTVSSLSCALAGSPPARVAWIETL